MTQKDIIKEHLEKYGSITSWEAITRYHITRISAIILMLRKEGMNILTQMSESTGGRGNTYAIYTLILGG